MADKEEKIGGFDKWEISSAFETLTTAKEILKDKKKLAAIKIYAKERIAATKEVAAELKLEKTVGKKLKSVFKKNNPHNSHKNKNKKKSGY